MRNSPKYRIVILVSTVNPGDCRNKIIPWLEDASYGECGTDFGFVYSPEFIRQGTIVHDYQNPDLVLIGSPRSDTDLETAVSAYYRSVTDNFPPIHLMSLESAEIAKVGLNTMLSNKIMMAGELAWLCQKTPHADARDVLKMIGADHRIGHDLMRPGTWTGGPCLPRDARALHTAMLQRDVLGRMPEAIDETRDAAISDLRSLLYEILYVHYGEINSSDLVALLGLAYKPGLDITEASPGWEMMHLLKGDCIAHDFVCKPGDLDQIVEDCVVLLLMTPDVKYYTYFATECEVDLSGKTVVDMWGFFEDLDWRGARYIRFGKGSER
jgi:UDPglucose 6-dehydrogenase